MPTRECLERAGWGYGGHDRVLHWYEPKGPGQWDTLCGKRLMFVRHGPGKGSAQFHPKCKTCMKKLKKKDG